MTKRQRAQVVELLRCAADGSDPRRHEGINGLILAAKQLDADTLTELAARDAYWEIRPFQCLDYEQCRSLLLEAAQRVEENAP